MRSCAFTSSLLLLTFIFIFALPKSASATLNANQIQEILTSRTLHYLGMRGYRLSDQNWQNFESAIFLASEDIATSPPSVQPQKLDEASSNIRVFIDVMIGSAQSRSGYGMTLGETTYADARSILCPLWPICK